MVFHSNFDPSKNFMLVRSVRLNNPKVVLLTGPSVKAKYDEAMQKLNAGLAAHVAGSSLMLLSSASLGASPIPTAIFGGLLWMQVMSTAKVTELGGWVNLCKNVVKIERVVPEGADENEPIRDREHLVLVTDGSRMKIETIVRKGGDDEDEDAVKLPSLKTLRELGIVHVDEAALVDSSAVCQELFARDDILVTMNESVKQTMEPPPGASKSSIPKLAEIYQRRQNAIEKGNKRFASIIANAPPMEPAKMLDRLGTASLVMGSAVFVLGGGMFLASKSQRTDNLKPESRKVTQKSDEVYDSTQSGRHYRE